jgi:DNA-binding Xre family transcriptional regulator
LLIIAKPGFRQRVARRGYSMFSLAKEAGLAKESVTRLARGRPVRAATARKLCQVLKVEFDEMFEFVEDANG